MICPVTSQRKGNISQNQQYLLTDLESIGLQKQNKSSHKKLFSVNASSEHSHCETYEKWQLYIEIQTALATSQPTRHDFLLYQFLDVGIPPPLCRNLLNGYIWSRRS